MTINRFCPACEQDSEQELVLAVYHCRACGADFDFHPGEDNPTPARSAAECIDRLRLENELLTTRVEGLMAAYHVARDGRIENAAWLMIAAELSERHCQEITELVARLADYGADREKVMADNASAVVAEFESNMYVMAGEIVRLRGVVAELKTRRDMLLKRIGEMERGIGEIKF